MHLSNCRAPRIEIVVWALLFSLCLCLWPPRAALAEVTAHEGEIELPTYPWDPPVHHPCFRETDGKNIYPYPMLDNLQREKEQRVWRTVVLENEYLRVTFLPELGGRVYEVLDKTTSEPVFYVNHVVKPGLIGQCGAWISGGIEFNTGPAGHTVSAVQPVDVEILPPARDGSRSVAVGEVEKIYGTRWTVLVTLRPGRAFLEETIRIYNRTETVRPYYFWNCTAVPNTPGFRFIYPMTLGTDHAGTTFYTWPVSEGKDLSYGKNYQDAASIFAYECDQDFFGSYDEDADRGVVAYANHHVLGGKKAWTWGWGSYGTMHQMDLTDDDGPYNEVQTGPLPTQSDVGRLDPHEVVAWQEWWYPVHGIGGFTFANRDVVVNATPRGKTLRLRMISTARFPTVEVRVFKNSHAVGSARAELSPAKPKDLKIQLGGVDPPLEVELSTGDGKLARFQVPLNLPVRTPPEKRKVGDSAAELSRSGWQDFLFARHDKAEGRFREALEKDPKAIQAHTGLAFLSLDRDPQAAASESRAALGVDPDLGLARFALAVAELRMGHEKTALAEAWKAALDPATAVAGRALAAKILLRFRDWDAAARALSAPGHWASDPLARNRLALALWKKGETRRALWIARRNLRMDPLDGFARSILWLAGEEVESLPLSQLLRGKAQSCLDLAATYVDLGQDRIALRVLEEFYLRGLAGEGELMPFYWAAYLSERAGKEDAAARYLDGARRLFARCVFPHRRESVPVLRWAVDRTGGGKAALCLGHLLFALGRHDEGRGFWQRAAATDLGAAGAVALRALGMARFKLDGDPKGAGELLTRAHKADPADPIVARDLARVLFSLAGGAQSDNEKKELTTKARDTLRAAFAAGKGRSDFVALLARASNRLGEFEKTARLLDSVRITIWEGAREAHGLFEEAHLELGKKNLEAGRAVEALREFDRALEYPKNLATGRPENTREAHIHYLRGKALEKLGQHEAALAAWTKAANEPPSSSATKEEARKKAGEALEQAKARNF